MRPAVQAAVAAALGESVTDTRVLTGGDINDAYRVTLASGRAVFVKTHERADPRMFPSEAHGLAWLTHSDGLRVPRVLAVSESHGSGPHFLALELLVGGARASDYKRRLGHGLATLHARGADCFGLEQDNFIATLEQPNRALDSWPEFYSRRRLLPLVERAVTRGLAPIDWRSRFERLAERLVSRGLCGPEEPPARLHGDLWSGNLHTDERGQPCLIDPAVYGGHREMDLAMLALFGGLDEQVVHAYDERYPLASGRTERIPLYQLYPLLVHVNLFGGSYVGSVERALKRYL